LDNPNLTTSFRLGTIQTLNSNSSGQVYGSFTADPSASGLAIPEYTSYIVNMYAEVRLVSLRCTFMLNSPEVKSLLTGQPMAIAPQTVGGSGVNSYSSVLDNPRSRLWNAMQDTSSRGFTCTLIAQRPLNYASTATPVSLTPAAGCVGSIIYYGAGYPVSTTGIFFVRIELVIQCKSRD
jgi:hypothetical protein